MVVKFARLQVKFFMIISHKQIKKMNQKELIEYFKAQTEKAIKSHGVDSDYTIFAMFVLQAALVGSKKPYEIARTELDRLQKIRIDEWLEVV